MQYMKTAGFRKGNCRQLVGLGQRWAPSLFFVRMLGADFFCCCNRSGVVILLVYTAISKGVFPTLLAINLASSKLESRVIYCMNANDNEKCALRRRRPLLA